VAIRDSQSGRIWTSAESDAFARLLEAQYEERIKDKKPVPVEHKRNAGTARRIRVNMGEEAYQQYKETGELPEGYENWPTWETLFWPQRQAANRLVKQLRQKCRFRPGDDEGKIVIAVFEDGTQYTLDMAGVARPYS
jgi:hypothetical protein